jgi:hypothetical protein
MRNVFVFAAPESLHVCQPATARSLRATSILLVALSDLAVAGWQTWRLSGAAKTKTFLMDWHARSRRRWGNEEGSVEGTFYGQLKLI